MATRELIDIILRLRKEGTAGKDVKKEMEDVAKGTDKAGSAFDDLQKKWKKVAGAGATVAGALYTLKKAYDFGKEGAAILQTSESFDRLMASMGAGPDVLGRLQAASRGTVDDMTLMSSTMTLLAGTSETLGMAMVDAAPRLMEIAKAANKLNPALGDTAFMYQSIATGVKRAQPLILDNLGLTLKVGDANAAYAKQLGKTVDQLTAEEKSVAILNATLEAGDRMIQQVGGSTEAMGDSFAEAETKLKNVTDELKTRLTPAAADAAEEFARFLIVAGGDLPDELAKTVEAAEGTGKSFKQLAEEAREAKAMMIYGGPEQEEAKLFWIDMTDKVRLTAEEFVKLGLAAEQSWPEIVKLAELMGVELDRTAWADYAEVVLNAKDAVEPWVERQQEAIEAAQKLDSELVSLEGAMVGVGSVVGPLTDAVDTGATAAFRMADGADYAATQIWKEEEAARAAAEAGDNFRGSLDLLHEAMSGEFGESLDEYTSNMGDLEAKMEELVAKEKELAGQPLVTDSQRDRLTDLRGDIGETTTKLGEAKEAYATLMAEGADAEQLEKAQGNIDKWQGKLDELNTKVGRTWRDISNATKSELADVRGEIDETAEAIDAESEAFLRNTREVMFNIAEKQILDALEKGLIEDVNASGTAYDEATTMLWTLGQTMGLVDDDTLALMKATQDNTQAMIDGEISAERLGLQFSNTADQAARLADRSDDARAAIGQIPDYKKVTIEYHMSTTGTGPPSGEGGPGLQHEPEPTYHQHGGQFMVRGPAGPDRVPVRMQLTRGEVVTVTPVGGQAPPDPTVTNNYNLNVTSTQPSAGIQNDFNIMQAMV